MTAEYWRAKIWGLLHDPVLKALHNNSGRGKNSFYKQLEVMKPWVETGKTPDQSGGKVLENILLADYIASASDRSALGSVTASINYAPGKNREKGLEITHLLSGARQEWKINSHDELIKGKRKDYLVQKEQKELLAKVPKELQDPSIKDDIKKIKQLYWWLWRCLPQATCDLFKDNSLMLMPAETRIPDASIWSHLSMTSALAGALAGYDLTAAQIQRWQGNDELSHPYLAVFSFSPVQELIKSSRKMRDFWAGSWLLHYLSAKVCWKLANQYGPDTLLYPSLYQQPLIDHWLLQEIEKLKQEEKIDFDFSEWVKQPSSKSLLTAGFPNVISLILPKDKVQAAMQTAQQTLLEEWLIIGDLVFKELHDKRHWMRELKPDHNSWQGWLKSQWQVYWTALPIGKGKQFKTAAIPENVDDQLQNWLNQQNQAYNVSEKQKLFQSQELKFLRDAYHKRLEEQHRKFSVNVGSWWGYIFDATRASLAAVKNARNWELPTAFGPRSTISGIGPVVSSGNKDKKKKDWITEGDTKESWEKHDAGFFDGTEQLNATEVVKRCLHEILPDLLGIKKEDIAASYPDLTSGVAGYLRVNQTKQQENFDYACEAIIKAFPSTKTIIDQMYKKWGIPWIDSSESQKYHCRLLNAGWLVEDLQTPELKILQIQLEKAKEENKEVIRKQIIAKKRDHREDIQKIITEYYPKNNPSDWYVLAAGDGDSMSEWLKGIKLKNYGDYIPSELSVNLESFPEFLAIQKRMGPSTHSALSRALLDFSNQLVPYLTQSRYAGRLIYGGGDDVLAYTNLWEWDKWLWDIRQCFKGAKDPHEEFSNDGDYWKFKGKSDQLVDRPLFTMGSTATISFGIVIAHHSVPLAIALESLWDAEKKAKDHVYIDNNGEKKAKDAVQVRVLYSNGNTLKSTAKFCVFHQWQQLITNDLESAIFEQAASLWSQHPAPSLEAIVPWTKAFCDRRDQFQNDKNSTLKTKFQKQLADFFTALFITTEIKQLDNEIQSWLKLAAFVKRNRDIKVRGEN
ncbi:type III-B CRISPR-associated protein Cas10/Cmr2 [Dolichospermum circinale]|uniref:type III-B CRISPR-associated protein Cas10/Cmr2 n=1 Tax=Dolichospermum circinale TaxID=109265 RepID=UPI002330EA7D|nr:type III-B CRISPR-associated protein Cas10/Cmr2 [Dolichospermum circinale]MDB9454602.1 type III-B CRISPR-associated protein Cas10/Cmr2 [Dolichospermum circinale CS-541/06]MDB9462284.1 type III-B CRISPR-associated protein Cas10/Cmr2 [Dolichospermum circinale CS-541/04]MDB9547383.1 type III-B CRISPR-associated protein Cas10/Cmr2 [Dolichospermum circinale CS-1031]